MACGGVGVVGGCWKCVETPCTFFHFCCDFPGRKWTTAPPVCGLGSNSASVREATPVLCPRQGNGTSPQPAVPPLCRRRRRRSGSSIDVSLRPQALAPAVAVSRAGSSGPSRPAPEQPPSPQQHPPLHLRFPWWAVPCGSLPITTITGSGTVGMVPWQAGRPAVVVRLAAGLFRAARGHQHPCPRQHPVTPGGMERPAPPVSTLSASPVARGTRRVTRPCCASWRRW